MSKAYIAAALRSQVTEDFAGRCAYCRSPELLLDGIYEVDHILPEANQGETKRENLCLACRLCNLHKGTQQYGVDPVTNRRVYLFHPRQQRWERHFRWTDDGLRIEGRTQCGRATVVALQLNDTRLLRMRGYWQELSAFPPDWERKTPVR